MPIYGADGKVALFTKAEYDRDKAILKKYGKPKCPKCYGRGYMGMNTTTGKLIVCTCVNTKELVKEYALLNQVKKKLGQCQ